MTPAQELLREIRDDLRALGAWELLNPSVRDAVDQELTDPGWPGLIGPATGEQTYRRFGLVREPAAPPVRFAEFDDADEDDR